MNPIDVNHKFDLVPDSATGTRRAVMIGINYVGEYVIADNHSLYGNLQLSYHNNWHVLISFLLTTNNRW